MPKSARRAGLVLLCGLLGACDQVVGPERGDSPVRTDATDYQLVERNGEYRAYVLATYQNTTGSPVAFARCMGHDSLPMFGIVRTGPDSTRRFFTDWAWACVGGVPTGALQPGQSVAVRVPFGSLPQPRMQPPLQPEELVGTFRVTLSLCRSPVQDSDYCELLPRARRESNAFLVHY